MEDKAFLLLHEAENSWWYRGRARVARAAAGRVHLRDARIVLDFGAGFGGMLPTLQLMGGEVYAFEPELLPAKEAATRGYTHVYTNVQEALTRQYDAIALFDVIEHVENDAELMVRLRDSLSSKGAVVITTPAFPFLWSVHDISHHHFRRYRKSGLKKLLEDAGYTVEFISYWNFFLFPLAVLMRLLNRSGEGALGAPGIITNICEVLISIEAALMQFIPLPFGVSFVVVARKSS
ncbi:class I SAM-dependent methyltransferase [Acetobacteraceae bacterium]|nr:class I SAM-dependent methyltransferase [Candidatus Parcubacteria bacterium]